MPSFDRSRAFISKEIPPSTVYHSYMCPSKREYLNKSTTTENDECMWINTQPKLSRDKHIQQNISKLREILSDTIANLTRENNLKKGESIELRLEIEMMKSNESTPTNSLVEVTILQHNNKRESDTAPEKMLLEIGEDEPLLREPLSQNHLRWIRNKNICEKEIIQDNDRSKGDRQLQHGIPQNIIHKPLFCPTANQRLNELNNSQNNDARNYFINVLPEKSNHHEKFSKHYKQLSQKENRCLKSESTSTDTAVSKQLTKKNSLMKKMSELVLPSKKPSKNQVIQTTLTALKNEIDDMKIKLDEKENYKCDGKQGRIQVRHFGKLVNNILTNVMEKMDSDDKNKLKGQEIPLQYQSFFEPVGKTSKKPKGKKISNRKKNLPIKKLYRSHSDSCCVKPLTSELELRLRSSNSISDCRSFKATRTPELEIVGDTKQTHKKRRKMSKHRDHSRSKKKKFKNDSRVVQNAMAKIDKNPYCTHPKALYSRTSLIQWNGRSVKVSKDVKTRIEMLIVNELENLALKEGMECDVTPLSLTDDMSKTSTSVEKMSSFMCELDISDKNVKKILKKNKSIQKKVSVHHSFTTIFKMDNYHPTQKARTCNTITTTGKETLQDCVEQTQKNRNKNCINKVNTCSLNDVEDNCIEIKYVNKNAQNWSAESQNNILYNLGITSDLPNTSEYICKKNKSDKFNKFIPTGFVKVIKSDDSTWHKHCSRIDSPRRRPPTQDLPDTNINTTALDSFTNGKYSSKLSNDLGSSIQIELDIQELEYILKEAKQNYKADKVLIEAKRLRSLYKRNLKPTRKSSLSYTNQLLTNAAKKLETYAKTKSRNKKY